MGTKLTFHILTIFPEIFDGFVRSSLIAKAIERGTVSIKLQNIREFAEPPHYKVDDTPYGGSAGMVMKPEPLTKAIETIKASCPTSKVILLSASGQRFDQSWAQNLSLESDLILVCGRYEGVDQRVIDLLVDYELSIGDFVLMGGEVAGMAIVEACARLLPEVLGNSQSLHEESFSRAHSGEQLLEGPHYTRPPEFRGRKVPEILLSGDHAKIAEWRNLQARAKTEQVRPDLLAAVNTTKNKT